MSETQYVCELCGYTAPDWAVLPPWKHRMCAPKGLGAWRGHNFRRVEDRTTHPLPQDDKAKT